jgi:hypothetical protein
MFNLQSKCANPGCSTPFDWHLHGRFFCLPRARSCEHGNFASSGTPSNRREQEHFWLCERCSKAFTLVYEPDCRIVLRPRWFEGHAVEIEESTTA